jgi:Protein of unknown function (DUF1064)
MMKHKYKAHQIKLDEINFQSKKEARRYSELKLLRNNGDVIFFLRQVPFHLPGNVKYICDFQIFWSNGEVTFEDVKGFKTPLYQTKKKIVESLYPIKIIDTIK